MQLETKNKKKRDPNSWFVNVIITIASVLVCSCGKRYHSFQTNPSNTLRSAQNQTAEVILEEGTNDTATGKKSKEALADTDVKNSTDPTKPEPADPSEPAPADPTTPDTNNPNQVSCSPGESVKSFYRLTPNSTNAILASAFGVDRSQIDDLSQILARQYSSDSLGSIFQFNVVFAESVMDFAESFATLAESAVRARVACTNNGNALSSTCAQMIVNTYLPTLTRQLKGVDTQTDLSAAISVAAGFRNKSEAIQHVIAAMVVQSELFMRSQMGHGADDQLSGYEIAEAISFELTESPPTAQLLSLAEQGDLSDLATLESAITSLMSTTEAKNKILEKLKRVIPYDRPDTIVRNDSEFNKQDGNLAQALVDDADTFVATKLSGGELDVEGLFSGVAIQDVDHIATVTKNQSLRDDLALGIHNAGILTHPSFLASYNRGGENNIIKRGLYIRTKLLCGYIPAPPPDIPDIVNAVQTESFRQDLEIHTTNASCAGCHQAFDPLAYPFDAYDPLGRLKKDLLVAKPELLNGAAAIGSEVVNFSSAESLASHLLNTPETLNCIETQLFPEIMPSFNPVCQNSDLKSTPEGNRLLISKKLAQHLLQKTVAP